jgi:FHA domain-containing protein
VALHGPKSLRQFQCNDALWVTYRRIAEDQDKEVDDVIADALEAYAELSGYQSGIHAAAAHGLPTAASVDDGPSEPHVPPPPPPPPSRSRFTRAMPEPSHHGFDLFHAGALTPPPVMPPPQAYAEGAAAAPLYLIFDNQKYRIEKDQFIIGRGAKSSDLPIKDGNISRKHAAVIRRNGTYFIKDLGSTNGIDFKGMRIDNKRIDEGDVFHLCDYELRFTYKR